MAAERKREGEPQGLPQFLRAFQELTQVYAQTAAKLSPEPETVPLVNHYSDVVSAQVRALSDAIVEAYQGAGPEVRGQVDQMLQLTAANQLASGAMQAIRGVRSPAAFAVIGELFPIIKKIIRILADLLGVSLPGIVIKILELIDELLGGEAASVSRSAAEQMHRAEIRFLEAQYHLERLVQLEQARGREAEEANGR